jgi:hypothetical protein
MLDCHGEIMVEADGLESFFWFGGFGSAGLLLHGDARTSAT